MQMYSDECYIKGIERTSDYLFSNSTGSYSYDTNKATGEVLWITIACSSPYTEWYYEILLSDWMSWVKATFGVTDFKQSIETVKSFTSSDAVPESNAGFFMEETWDAVGIPYRKSVFYND